MGELDIGTRPATSNPKKEIVGVMIQGVVVGMKISAIITCPML